MTSVNYPLLEEFQAKTVQEFSKTLEMFGLTSGDARLFIILYIHPFPMTLDDMSKASGKSKTSMSTGIRSLLEQGLVERVWVKGKRKDFYQANKNLYLSFLSSFIEKWIQQADEQKDNLERLQAEMAASNYELVEEGSAEEADLLYEKAEEMKVFQACVTEAFTKILALKEDEVN
ncbi:transcriptional regulator [Salimicrobium jeotgali]|uniref:HTH-type transcriptional regulator n=2 Tax=Salimicrobium TaxID=351195 RepID=K2G8L4_9BACI|nr:MULTISPECIES: helix-turn-helix domain-containing protein [Salimicrobium]AKG05015.1 transcriptional regulator [Salimicrobium jeotgali]EKE30677.1 YuaC family transcription regulator [Salimicrobium jeotgali]MBM7696912.1 DNA-binding transcriptional regulator GbsR (MarR family) [Salimicrobium jeotgali]SIS44574.1 DNA-binding transcriptional regulator GbsR, MarR family [Salimicrobium salexigens]